jgi:hypothetical protein
MGVRWQVAALVATMAAMSLEGCVVQVSGSSNVHGYDTCVAGDTCLDGTTCLSANQTTSGFVGNFCTASCDVSLPQCPADPQGTDPVVCVPDNGSTTTGQCYLGCTSSADCPGAETCAVDSSGSGISFCVP